MKILLVEDDQTISKTLAVTLTSHRYLVDTAADGEAGWELADAFDYDLILLDVMLPKLDGISLCRRLRDRGNVTPILLLTAQDTSTSKTMGLDAGADDYVVKPFDTNELLARIRALLRRGSNALPPVIEWRHLRLDPSACEVTYEDRPISLTRKEYNILELFLRNSRRIFSQSVILDLLWSFEESPGENTVRAHVKSLRQKLKRAGAPADLIETVYGLGYRLRIPKEGEAPVLAPPPEAPSTSPARVLSSPSSRSGELSPPPESQPAEGEGERVHAELFDIWLETRSQILTRMAAVRRSYQALEAGALPDDVREQAIQNAHLLVGSLGILGLMRGSQAARHIEMALKHPTETDTVETIARELTEFDRIVALPTEVPIGATVAIPDGDRPRIVVAARDRAFTEALSVEVTHWNFQLETVETLDAARRLVLSQPPDAIVLDLDWPGDENAGFEVLASAPSTTAVIALTNREGLTDRVRVARAGGKGCLQKPVAPSDVCAAVKRAIAPVTQAVSKVMVVDDSEAVLADVEASLEPWGIETALVEDPQQFWTTLNDIRPDLLVLDTEMPSFSGIDLCQVVRNDSQWNDLPVLMLAESDSPSTIHQLFAAGAADYVRKPIVQPELVARVLARLEQSHLLRRVSATERALNYQQHAVRELSQLLRLALRQERPFSLAAVDIRGLGGDDIDEATGDRVLQHLGDRLRETFRQEDVVALWSARTFAIGMYDMNERNGMKRLSAALDGLVLPPDLPAGGLTCAVGIVQYSDDDRASDRGDILALHQAATAAMHNVPARPLGRLV